MEAMIVEQFDAATKEAAGDCWIRLFVAGRIVARVQYWSDAGDRERAEKFAADLCRAHNSHEALVKALRDVEQTCAAGVIQRNETGKPQWSALDHMGAIARAAIAKATA